MTDDGPRPADAGRELAEAGQGLPPDRALAWFDSLDPVAPQQLLGRWRGSGVPTGSPLDGLLEGCGWWGKELLDAETVHPLLFADRRGRPRPLQPAVVPLWLVRGHPGVTHHPAVRTAFRAARPLLTTRSPAARLRTVEHRGVATAAIVYDRLPVVDVFRRVTDDVRLGLMDMRGFGAPFLFLLRRDG